MSWTEKYWDTVDHFYWAPQYIGLKSIPKKHWSIEEKTVSIPKEMTNPSGPLYRRTRKGQDYRDYVRRQEETFNHIFSLTFAILPGDVIGELLGNFTKTGCGHSYESMGRELRVRYGWGEHDNITTPDGFFIAERSVLAVELKFDARTSLDQLAKYAVLLTAEDGLGPKNRSLDLLYVFNRDPLTAFHQQAGFKHDAVGGHLFDALLGATNNATVSSFFPEQRVRSEKRTGQDEHQLHQLARPAQRLDILCKRPRRGEWRANAQETGRRLGRRDCTPPTFSCRRS